MTMTMMMTMMTTTMMMMMRAPKFCLACAFRAIVTELNNVMDAGREQEDSEQVQAAGRRHPAVVGGGDPSCTAAFAPRRRGAGRAGSDWLLRMARWCATCSQQSEGNVEPDRPGNIYIVDFLGDTIFCFSFSCFTHSRVTTEHPHCYRLLDFTSRHPSRRRRA